LLLINDNYINNIRRIYKYGGFIIRVYDKVGNDIKELINSNENIKYKDKIFDLGVI